MEFVKMQKIPRFRLGCTITEKIDGTNACIYIGDDGEFLTGSRNRWITPDDDNHGFSWWAYHNKDELLKLGPGRHFGEWWGQGIQRKYGMGHKRFSLFNVKRWEGQDLPAFVDLVPVLYTGQLDTIIIGEVMHALKSGGSVAAPGFDDPEGIVIRHECGYLYKLTFDDKHKGEGNV